MDTFSVKFRAGSLDLDAIVTQHDHYQKFKVEMVTREPEPILLTRSLKGEWKVAGRGSRNFSEKDFDELEQAIEAQLNETYGVKSMLVLTDFSEAASNAARYAAALAEQLGTTELILYHSYESIALPPTASAPVTGGFTETSDLNRQKITDLKNELEELTPAKTTINIRSDERNLLNAVNILTGQQHLGLVVAGITGKSALERVLIGSTTIDLAKNCQAPLLIVPPAKVFEQITTVVFACDLKRISQSTPVLPIKTIINTLGARLLILSVDDTGRHKDAIKQVDLLHELWDDHEPEYHHITHEDTALGIMEFAAQQNAGLVITVPGQYGFFESIFHRSMTEKLAYHTHIPLLLFKEDL
jgi:nucleotide-binding universal stress UspA family protein